MDLGRRSPFLVILCCSVLVNCSRFNLSFESDELFVLGSTTAPYLQFVKLSSSRNSLEFIGSLNPTHAPQWSFFSGGGIVLSNGPSGISTVGVLGSSRTVVDSLAMTSSRSAVTPEGNAILYGDPVGDVVKVRALSAGRLGTSDVQSVAISAAGEIASLFAFPADTSRVVVSLNGVGALVSRTTDGRLGSVLVTFNFGSDNSFLENVAALGSEYFVYDVSGGNPQLGRVNSAGFTYIGATGFLGAYAVNPVKPWIIGTPTPTTMQVFLLTTTGVSALQTSTVPSRVVSLLLINLAGDRIIEFAGTGSLNLYSLSSTGQVALLSTLSVSAATKLIRVAPARKLP